MGHQWKDAAGRYRQRRTECATKAEARMLVREVSRKAEFQRAGLEAPRTPTELTFGELLDWYWENFGSQLRSKGTRQSVERHLRPALGHRMLAEVNAAFVDEALAALGKEKTRPLAPKSVNNL